MRCLYNVLLSMSLSDSQISRIIIGLYLIRTSTRAHSDLLMRILHNK